MPGDESSMSLETQVALLRVRIDLLIDINAKRGEDHEQRIRMLEERRFPMKSLAIAISALAVGVAVAGVMFGN